MEEESFMDPDVGRMLNEHFVPIKVDRETRPDVDRLYMSFLVATTGGGGWPMSVFLTPDAKPFLAGTYYPQPAKYDRPGFLDLLTRLSQEWERDPAAFQAQAGDMAQRLQSAARPRASSATLARAELVAPALEQWQDLFDPELGGFGSAPKFPQAPVLSFLLDHGSLDPQSGSQKMALRTLEAMALGGLRDQLEGGFHRYSTDDAWRVPHFEKMLSDQAQLLELYGRAYALTGQPLFQQAGNEIATYMQARLTLSGGGLASAEDADSALVDQPDKHFEGAFYVWTQGELQDALTPELVPIASKLFAITAEGNSQARPGEELAGKNVLLIADQKSDQNPLAREIKDRLRAARDQRPRPARDEKALTAWNAMAAGALAEASQTLGRPEYLPRAQDLMSFLEKSMVVDGRLRRSHFDGQAEVDAFAQDYAELVGAYLALQNASGSALYLERAVHWQQEQDKLFADPQQGGYFETPVAHGLLYRDKELQDGALRSTASRSALNLVRLYRLTGNAAYRTSYDRLLQSLGDPFQENPRSLPGVLQAVDLMEGAEESAVLVGDKADWWRLLHKGYHPQRTLLWLKDQKERQTIAPLVAYAASLPAGDAVYFCQNFACGLPLTSTAALERRISGAP